MRTLLIDNYDSFSYNLFQILAEVNGEPPVVVRNDTANWREVEADNIVISPGPGRADRVDDFGICMDAILHAGCPVLGVCLGHQGIATAFGGELIYAPEPMHGRLSPIVHDGSELFEGVPQGFGAVRYHSFAVRTPLPEDLVETAWSGDVLMGLRHRKRPIWGVQFHPESISTEFGRTILENFAKLTAWGKRGRPAPVFIARQRPTQRAGYRWRWRELAAFPDPEAVFDALYARELNTFWFDSCRAEPGLARFSFMGAGHPEEKRNGVFDFLESELPAAVPPLPFPFDFVGGYVGYLGYELKAECGAGGRHRSLLPDAGLLFVDRFLAFDHEERKVWLVAVASDDADSAAEQWLDSTEAKLANVPAAPELQKLDAPGAVRLLRGRDDYLRDIERCLEKIRDGESYEICLTNKVLIEADPDQWQFYRALRRANPAPYAAFLRFDGFAVACTSPERFLRIGTDGWVESKPIKGTAPIAQSARLLSASEKDRAENLMIVDLLRNDLGRVCIPGTVSVPKLMDVETYATLHQLVSTIRGRLRPECSAVDCIRAAFPGGSMTGAPKLRTMGILDELETEARGVYSGAIGYLSLNGAVDLNVVIRTAVLTGGRVEIGTGGGIVALSDPEEEFAEMLLKAESVTRAMGVTLPGRAEVEKKVIYLR